MQYSDYLDGANDNKKKRRYPQPIESGPANYGNRGPIKPGPISRRPSPNASNLAGALSGVIKKNPIQSAPGRGNAGDKGVKADQMKKDAIRRRLGNIAKR